MSKDTDFPADRWEDIKNRMESGGPDSVVELARSFEDPAARRRLLAFAQQALMQREWRGKSLDPYVVVARAAIGEMLAQADAAEGEDAKKLTDSANVLSYNLAADLAPCWPGDEFVRERRHHEVGLEAAGDCVRWREELGKGPFPKSIAWWAKGVHALALGRAGDAVASFRSALDLAGEAADGAAGDFNTILCSGFLGLAETAAGREDGRSRLSRSIEAFRAQVDAKGEDAENAAFGIEQLETMQARLPDPE